MVLQFMLLLIKYNPYLQTAEFFCTGWLVALTQLMAGATFHALSEHASGNVDSHHSHALPFMMKTKWELFGTTFHSVSFVAHTLKYVTFSGHAVTVCACLCVVGTVFG